MRLCTDGMDIRPGVGEVVGCNLAQQHRAGDSLGLRQCLGYSLGQLEEGSTDPPRLRITVAPPPVFDKLLGRPHARLSARPRTTEAARASTTSLFSSSSCQEQIGRVQGLCRHPDAIRRLACAAVTPKGTRTVGAVAPLQREAVAARAADPAPPCGAAAVSDPSSAAASPRSVARRRTRGAGATRVPGIAGRDRARER